VLLTLEDNAVPIASLARTPNQKATGAGIDSLGGGVLEDALSTLGAADIPPALDLLSGEIHASIKSAFIEESRYLRDAASNRIRSAFGAVGAKPLPVMGYGEAGPIAAEVDTPLAAWGEALGAWGSFDGDGNAAEFDRSTGGFLTGIDALVSDNARLGLIAGYTHSEFDVDDRASSGSADSAHLGAYGGLQLGDLGLRAGAAYSWHFIDTSRAVAFGGFADSLAADYDAATAQVFGEAGYRVDTASVSFEPFANVAYVNLHTDGFTETGGAAALTHEADNTDQTFTTIGVRASTPIRLGGSDVNLSGMVGWRHAFNDVTPDAVLSFAGGAPFSIAGTPVARDALALEAGIDMKIGAHSSLGISYSGQIGDGAQDHSANAKLTVSF
jgi:outer membrane autotransporter protein